MDFDQYLQRIGTDHISNNNLTTLSKLQHEHMISIPFENLDVIKKIPISLNIDSYFKKIVTNNRGGFCYELNGLFHSLLQHLRFETTLVAARVKRADRSWSMPTSHACLVVHLDVPYLVDVGFGDSVRTPLPLTGEVKEDVSGTYRMKQFNEFHNPYSLPFKSTYRLD